MGKRKFGHGKTLEQRNKFGAHKLGSRVREKWGADLALAPQSVYSSNDDNNFWCASYGMMASVQRHGTGKDIFGGLN